MQAGSQSAANDAESGWFMGDSLFYLFSASSIDPVVVLCNSSIN